MLMRQKYPKLHQSSLASVMHAIRAAYLYTLGYHPNATTTPAPLPTLDPPPPRRHSKEESFVYSLEHLYPTAATIVTESLAPSSASTPAPSVSTLAPWSVAATTTPTNPMAPLDNTEGSTTTTTATTSEKKLMVPIKTISDLISDLGLRVPCVEEAALLSNWTTLYLAEFSYASPDDVRVGNQKWIGSYHESDLQFAFGLPFLGLVNTLRAPLDRSVAAALMKLLVSFAKYGVPEVGGGVEWPAYEQTHPVHLQISANITLGYNLVKQR
ncbi:hypothetical protein Pcinc_034178 [Petrolisthes cinctipes]|uniref:Carboxylesterase type B domain-containing protein n=1 Tax=Petrolisthes cinctipes TaxID=88211 RepID=A0AAE1EQU7_PETCI|nr:hypothetical protein Pcinc_034178 [Petrolisthes cinctipes]